MPPIGVHWLATAMDIPVPDDFDLIECVSAHGWRKLRPFRWTADNVLQRTELIGAGRPVELMVRQENRALAVTVLGDQVDRDEVRNRVSRMLQLDVPMGSFHAFCAQYPKLAHIPGLRQGRMLRSPSLYEDVVKVIATTNTIWSQTIAMVERIVDGFGPPSTVSGSDGSKAFPDPETVASTTLDDFASVARMGYRNAAVHRISTEIAEGRLELEALQDPSIPAGDLYKRLLALPGVGPYAASCLMIYLGRYSRVNVDSWARMMVGKELGRSVTMVRTSAGAPATATR